MMAALSGATFFPAAPAAAQAPATHDRMQSSAAPDPLGELSSAQREVFLSASGMFAAGKFSDVLPKFKTLFQVTPPGSPAHVVIAKYTAEAAAKGERCFSMDGYSQGAPNAQGQSSQVHATYGFFEGQPPYDKVRERILEIAKRQTPPLSTATRGVTQK
jgi:hypothetical protein